MLRGLVGRADGGGLGGLLGDLVVLRGGRDPGILSISFHLLGVLALSFRSIPLQRLGLGFLVLHEFKLRFGHQDLPEDLELGAGPLRDLGVGRR